MIRKIICGLLLAATALSDRPAHGTYPLRWTSSTVCVEMRAATRYPVQAAAHAWDAAPQLRLTYHHDCTGYQQVVRVYSGWYGRNGWAAQTTIRRSGDRFVSPLTIRLNNSYAWNYSWANRAHLASHELGHALGETHTTHQQSVMHPSSYQYAYPQPHDYGEIQRLYPR